MRMNQDEIRFDFHGLGLAIKQAREERGWTQAYVAELVRSGWRAAGAKLTRLRERSTLMPSHTR